MLNIPGMSKNSFKSRECEVGTQVEGVTKASCEHALLEERYVHSYENLRYLSKHFLSPLLCAVGFKIKKTKKFGKHTFNVSSPFKGTLLTSAKCRKQSNHLH